MIVFTILITISLVGSLSWAQQSPCTQDILDRSFVTQCGPQVCEPLIDAQPDGNRPKEWPKSKTEVVHIVSSRGGHRFKVNTYPAEDRTDIYYEESHVNGTIFVDTHVKYQRILGFGTTLTDAACTNLDSLTEEIRTKAIADYFSPENGIGLNLIKVPIGSTKFSYTNYVLDQPDNSQVELSPYDTDHRIPLIKDAMKSAGKLKSRFKIIASSSSAPPDYKQNNRITHGGFLRSDKFSDYAAYLSGFVAAYRASDLNIWSLILGDSSATIAKDKYSNDTMDFSSMAMKPSDAIRLIKAIAAYQTRQTGADKFRLLLLGDDRSYVPVWADAVFRSSEVEGRVAGIAYTCNNQKFASYDNLVYVTRRYPNKYLLASQGSTNAPIKLGNWQYAENYATEMVKNLEYGSVGWIDFNMALNLEGGPLVSNRFKADAALMVDLKRGVYYRNPMFYAIGHLSRYVKPGSIRVRSQSLMGPPMYAYQSAAFVTPDNYLVVIVLNNNINPLAISIGINTRTKIQSLLDTKSFNTFIFRL